MTVGLVMLRVQNQRTPFDHGEVYSAVAQTLAKGGPVKDDLIKRGLVSIPTTNNNETLATPEQGYLKLNDIENLIESGVYSIDSQGYLVFGPNYNPP